jgi:hypothetical protein
MINDLQDKPKKHKTPSSIASGGNRRNSKTDVGTRHQTQNNQSINQSFN